MIDKNVLPKSDDYYLRLSRALNKLALNSKKKPEDLSDDGSCVCP